MHTIQFPLITTKSDDFIISKRYMYIAILHNQAVKYANRALRSLKRDKEYQTLIQSYRDMKKAAEDAKASKVDKDGAVEAFEKLKEQLRELQKKHGVTQSAIEQSIKDMRNKQFKKHISSMQAQKEADRVWKGVQQVLFGNGKHLRYKKWNDIITISGKQPTDGVKYYDDNHQKYIGEEEKKKYVHIQKGKKHWNGLIVWNGLEIRCKIDWSDPYVRESVDRNAISYCEIKRSMFSSGWRYYVILYLSGDAPKKLKAGKGKVGIDPGVSTEAIVLEKGVMLKELAPRAKEYNKHIAKLQRDIDREKRLLNPANYNKDGTIKKGKHSWQKSNNLIKKERLLKEAFRKKAAYISHSHHYLANRMVEKVNIVFVEEMDFKALQRRAKKTERSDKETVIRDEQGKEKTIHKYKRKKRFGKSINDRAPALFLKILKDKIQQYGGRYIEVDTRTFRASQYDHVADTYSKIPLSQRKKVVGGEVVQRDLYSAFLLFHSYKHGRCTNRRECEEDFARFVHDSRDEIERMKQSGESYPACFGF